MAKKMTKTTKKPAKKSASKTASVRAGIKKATAQAKRTGKPVIVAAQKKAYVKGEVKKGGKISFSKGGTEMVGSKHAVLIDGDTPELGVKAKTLSKQVAQAKKELEQLIGTPQERLATLTKAIQKHTGLDKKSAEKLAANEPYMKQALEREAAEKTGKKVLPENGAEKIVKKVKAAADSMALSTHIIEQPKACAGCYFKSEKCLACTNCAYDTKNPDGSVTIICDLEQRNDGQELTQGPCPNYNGVLDAEEENEDETEEKEEDEDYNDNSQEVAVPYTFVGDHLAHVENPAPGQFIMMLPVSFAEDYNQWVTGVQADSVKEIESIKASAKNKLENAKIALKHDPEQAVADGVDSITDDEPVFPNDGDAREEDEEFVLEEDDEDAETEDEDDDYEEEDDEDES